MEKDGANGNEGIVFWLGKHLGDVAIITHVLTLDERWLWKTPNFLQVSTDGMSALADEAERHEVVLVGQIHSHPGNYVDLSMADRRFGISAPYYLSVVAPHFAQDPSSSWRDCGVHVYERAHGFRRLSPDEVRRSVVADDARRAVKTHVRSSQ
jgi:proteasome lid subunit RPN8/RPN11